MIDTQNTQPQPVSHNCITGGIFSAIALFVCLSTVGLTYSLQVNKREALEQIAREKVVQPKQSPVPRWIVGSLTFFQQFFVIAAGGLIGGTLSIVGFSLSLAGWIESPNRTAGLGVTASCLGPIIVAGFLALSCLT